MLDPNFRDSEERKQLNEKQKSLAVKVIMGEMLDNPHAKNNDNMKKLLDYLDKQPNCDS